MTHDALHERGKALEDKFFKDRDRDLLEKMRKEFEAKGNRKALAAACGISDEAILDELLAENITAENLTAISIVPLVAVAWADNVMEAAEVKAVLKATHEAGIEAGTSAHALVESWLQVRPDDELLLAWKEYVRGLKTTVTEAAFSQLRSSVIERAKAVANSAGGFLGMGNKTSAVEQKVLDELESVFAG